MNDQQKKEQCSGVRDQAIRAALDRHWAASDASDFETEHLIYREDAVLEYPQSGEPKMCIVIPPYLTLSKHSFSEDRLSHQCTPGRVAPLRLLV